MGEDNRQRALALARQIARAYSGKSKSSGVYDWDRGLVCYFLVEGSYKGRALTFQVCDNGCVVEGATTRYPAVGFAWNHPYERIDRPVKDTLPPGALAAFHFRYNEGGAEMPPPRLDRLRDELRDFWNDPVSRAALLALELKRDESLLLLERPLFRYGRPQFYLTHRSFDLSDLERRLDVLFRFLPPVPPGADIAGQISERAYRVRISAATKDACSSTHRFGGTLEGLPPCANCGTPVHLVLTIDTRDAALNLPDLGHRLFRVVYCLNCMSWKPMFVDYSNERLRIVRQEKEKKVNHDPPLRERYVSVVALASPTTLASKVGGAPRWLQGPEIPDCARCGNPMTFFAQLRSLPDLAFGDDGCLYTFVCVGCKVTATFVQSH